MKTTKLVLSLCVALAIINLNLIRTNANTPTTASNIVYNSNQSITELKNVNIDGKVYNVHFIYGSLQEVYKQIQYIALNKIPDPVKAINAINTILNNLDVVPRVIAEKPKNRKYPAAYNNDSYMIPISVTEITYQKTSVEIRALYGIFDAETKQWQKSVVDDGVGKGILQYRYKSHGPRTAGVYTKFEEVKMTNKGFNDAALNPSSAASCYNTLSSER